MIDDVVRKIRCISKLGSWKRTPFLVLAWCEIMLQLLQVPLLVGALAHRMRVPPVQLSGIAPVAVPSLVEYLEGVAMTAAPTALSSAIGILLSRGEELIEPGTAAFNDPSLHPLLVPLTRTADGEPLPNRRCGITRRVERVRTRADHIPQLTHLG